MSHKSGSEIHFRCSTSRSSSASGSAAHSKHFEEKGVHDLRSRKDGAKSSRSRSRSDSKKKGKRARSSSSSSSSSPHSQRKKPKKSSSKSRRKKKHRRHSSSSSSCSSSDSSSSSSSTDSGSEEDRRKKKHKKHRKKKVKKEKKKTKKVKKEVADAEIIGPSIGPSLSLRNEAKAEGEPAGPRILKPMTKEEWEKKQSVIRRVYDPETGRNRLVKGDGEIIEEIVSRDRHKEINKQATLGDGLSYQAKVGMLK